MTTLAFELGAALADARQDALALVEMSRTRSMGRSKREVRAGRLQEVRECFDAIRFMWFSS